MSKSFIINITWLLAFFSLIFLFPDFFSQSYYYIKLHPYILVLFLDILLIVIYFLSMHDLKINHGKTVTLLLLITGSATFGYAYITKSAEIPFIITIIITILFGINILNKIIKYHNR